MSAICFNLDQSEILSSGDELKIIIDTALSRQIWVPKDKRVWPPPLPLFLKPESHFIYEQAVFVKQ